MHTHARTHPPTHTHTHTHTCTHSPGPGSGKTRVVAARIAHLLSEGEPASRVLGIAFTNKAAGELRGRVEGLLGHWARGLTMTTFHALCAMLLG